MQIDELLHVADEASLKAYVWGAGVVETLNHLLPAAQQLTTEISGKQALDLLRALPPAALPGILAIQFNLSTGRPRDENAPVVVPIVPPATVPNAPAAPKIPKVPLMFAAATTVIALLLTVVISVTAVKSGTGPDEGAMRLILSTLVELVKLFMTTPADPTPQTLLWF